MRSILALLLSQWMGTQPFPTAPIEGSASGPAQYGEPTFVWVHADLANYGGFNYRLWPNTGEYQWYDLGPNMSHSGSVTEICCGQKTAVPFLQSRYYRVIKNGVYVNDTASGCLLTLFSGSPPRACTKQVPPIPFKQGDTLAVATYQIGSAPTGDTSAWMMIRSPRHHTYRGFSSGPDQHATYQGAMRHSSSSALTITAVGAVLVGGGNAVGSSGAPNVFKNIQVKKFCAGLWGVPFGSHIAAKLRVNGVDVGDQCDLDDQDLHPYCCVDEDLAIDAGAILSCHMYLTSGPNRAVANRSCEIYFEGRP